MADRIGKEIKKEMTEFARYSKMTERFIVVLFVFTMVLIAVNLPAMIVDLRMLGAADIETLFFCEVLLVVVMILVGKKVLLE